MRASDELVEDLCIALRDVGVRASWEAPSETEVGFILLVQEIDRELGRREVPIAERLAELTQQTKWQMEPMLAECRAFPRARPWVRDLDGIRPRLRCIACSKHEYPESDRHFQVCDSCLGELETLLEQLKPAENVFLFRSYSPEARCDHADSDTPLAVYPWPSWHEFPTPGFCLACVRNEARRRRGSIGEA